MNAHLVFDRAQAEAAAAQQRVELAVATHPAAVGDRDAQLEQLALVDIAPVPVAAIATRSSIGQRPNRERGAWNAYRRRVLPMLWDRQGGVCLLCGYPIDLEADGRRPDGPSIDHIQPLMHGGQLIPESDHDVRLVHTSCNSSRGGRLRRRRSRAAATW